MKNTKTIRACAIAGGISIVTYNEGSAATMLGFDGLGPNDTNMEEVYGDNVITSDLAAGVTASSGVQSIVGTPDITLDWAGGAGAGEWDSFTGWDTPARDVVQTDYKGSFMTLTFTPGSATVGALITAFDLDEFTGGGATVIDWSILNGATTIVSGTESGLSSINGGSVTVNTGMTEAQAIANAGSNITLRLDLIGGSSSYQAMDNLTFDQVAVPEPSSSLLAVAGLGAMAMRRRRQ